MKRVLFLTPNPIESASERYRIHQFVPYLEHAGFECKVRPFADRRLFQAVQASRMTSQLFYAPFSSLRRAVDVYTAPRYDMVVIHREAFPFFCPRVERMVLRRHSRVVFSLDDAIYAGHRDTPNKKYPFVYKLKYGPGVNEVLAKSAHVIAGSRTLAEHARQFNPHVSVVPTVVDANRYAYRAPTASSECLTIGWMGTRSTSPYVFDIAPVLRQLGEVFRGQIRFRMYGDPQLQLPVSNYETRPFSLESEIEDLRRIDIGIMPLPDNEWTRGKCAFKAIQYMALGIPTVSSPVGMASEIIKHNVNGLLASTSGEWFEALARLMRDADLRRRLAEEGRKTIEACYSLGIWAPRFADLLDQILVGMTTTRCAAD
jgi:glycosyltransferase involved in cell wall biosynthesis